MPRKLPWQQKPVTADKATPSRSTKKRPSSDAERNGDRRPYTKPSISTESSRGTRIRQTDEEPPSSPMAEAPVSPPTPKYMEEGLSDDDRWIMVEDEFMSTAREFTRHLHQAEYNRLRTLARARNATATNEITQHQSHPGISNESKMRKQSEALAGKQAALLRPFESDGDSSDEPWLQNPHLAGLMSQSRQSSCSKLSNIAGNRPNTRASLGYSQSQSQDMEMIRRRITSRGPDGAQGSSDVDDDLDHMPLPRKQAARSPVQSRNPSRDFQPAAPFERRPDYKADRGSNSRYCEALPTSVTPNRITSAEESTAQRLTVLGISSNTSTKAEGTSAISSTLAERMAKRKAELARRKREEKSISMDHVPTFLI